MKITILHLADLHCSENDTCYLKTIAANLCVDLGKLAKDGIKPDIVCVTGDIVNKGENSETELLLAETHFLEPLQSTLKLPRDNFFFSPGNHDINRKQTSSTFETGLAQRLTNEAELRQYLREIHDSPDSNYLHTKLAAYRKFAAAAANKHCTHTSQLFDTFEISVNGIKVGIASLNSAWRSSQFGNDAGRLIVGDQTASEAASKLNDCQVRFCLCHHPLEMLAVWDAKPVRQIITKHFHILLNGHVHDPEAVSAKYLLGTVFVSTAGCLKAHEQFTSYTIIEVDLEHDQIRCHFRKWYSEREQFDKDTAKAPEGTQIFSGIKDSSAQVASALQLSTVRGRMQDENQQVSLISPIEGIEDVILEEVFVEPILCSRSAFDPERSNQTIHKLEDLLRSSENLIIAGRAEYGKTTLLRYIRDSILSHDERDGGTIPILIRFADLPRNHLKSVIRALGRTIHEHDTVIEDLAKAGRLTVLIDDYNDRQEGDRERRTAAVREFYVAYPKCRIIVSTSESISPTSQFELLTLSAEFKAKRVFIASLNTARIRQLLSKWRAKQDFDLEKTLHQILHYFEHCRIPVTPLSVILFLGVLCRKKKEKTIRNEAYLIENYLETILEKLSPTQRDGEWDFRDKEDFLASVAWEMVTKNRMYLDSDYFERVKLDYFDRIDDEIPNQTSFDSFFRNGILAKEDGQICFRRRFWFHFFLAKALESNRALMLEFLERPDVLKYSKALAYKAGLSRKDVELLRWVDERAMKGARPILDQFLDRELKDSGRNAPLDEISDAIAKELKEKNTEEAVDGRRDDIFLTYDEDKGPMDEEQMEEFDNLLSLESDIIRNTTIVEANEKRRFIDNNISCYIAMMWSGLEMFKEILQKTDEEDLYKLFFNGKKSTSIERKLSIVIEHAKRIVHFVVPLSVMIYMNEHLGNPKLHKSFRKLADASKSPTKKLFYYLLIFAQKPSEGLKDLKKMVTAESSSTEDYLISGFLQWFCHENKVEAEIIDKIVSIIDSIRRKYAKRATTDGPFLRDTFKSDMKKTLLLTQGTAKVSTP